MVIRNKPSFPAIAERRDISQFLAELDEQPTGDIPGRQPTSRIQPMASYGFVLPGDENHIYTVFASSGVKITDLVSTIMSLVPDGHLMEIGEAIAKGKLKPSPRRIILDAGDPEVAFTDFVETYLPTIRKARTLYGQ